MQRQRFDGEHGRPGRREGERLENEGTLIDQRPREKRRDFAFFAQIALGMLAGAGIAALCLWILAEIVGQHYSAFVYLLVAAIGASVAPGITPYLSLARSDGADAGTVKFRGRRGRADTPVEGAQAVDQTRVPESDGRDR